MGEVTKIQWCDHTLNVWIGCEKVAPECAHCYAEVGTFARTRRAAGRELWGPLGQRHRVADLESAITHLRQARDAGEGQALAEAALYRVLDIGGDGSCAPCEEVATVTALRARVERLEVALRELLGVPVFRDPLDTGDIWHRARRALNDEPERVIGLCCRTLEWPVRP